LQVFIGRDFGQGFVAENLHFGLRWESLFLDSCCGWGWEGWRHVTACVLWFGLGQKKICTWTVWYGQNRNLKRWRLNNNNKKSIESLIKKRKIKTFIYKIIVN